MKEKSPMTRVTQVTLKSSNPKELSTFYQEHIGLKEYRIKDTGVELSADGIHPLLVLDKVHNAVSPAPDATGLYHIALLLPSRAALADQLIHFQQIGTRLQGASDHHVSEAVYLTDPEGNGIEIYSDRAGIAPEEMGTDRLQMQDLLSEATGESWKGLPKTTIMGHVHLKVNDLKRTAAFYQQILGFDLMMELEGSAAFLSKGNYHHHIGLNTWESAGGSPPPENSVGLKHITLQLPRQKALHTLIEKLNQYNISFLESSGSLFTYDPSGNGIQVVVSGKEAAE
jgi:catechol 2,3-dioxygenase